MPYSAAQRADYSRKVREYTRTDPRWHARSSAFRAKYGNQCQACGLRGRCDAHHLKYNLNRPGLESDSDLRCLCRRCHDGVHTLAHSGIPLAHATDMVIRHGGPVSVDARDAAHSVMVWTLVIMGLLMVGAVALTLSYLGR